ncbi:GNAT family N-acetyltransferase [Kordiimonas sp.]|uniref:GNAT family N-acetyltransferase n=1 Tax=Kordiimonas sp. TaxID=1970157 RepID=UPI003A942C73
MSLAPIRHPDLPFYITSDAGLFNFDRIHGWLTASYWAKDIPFDLMVRSFENSLSFGLFHDESGQVGCARMITDRTTFAYLADVYINASCRGQKLGHWLMSVIMSHKDMQGLRRMMLATCDMHPLYAQFGFRPLERPEMMMEISSPGLYMKLPSKD